MNYGLLRSILKTIPTWDATAYAVDDDESLGDYLVALGKEMTSLRESARRTTENQTFEISSLNSTIRDLTEDRDYYRDRVNDLRVQVANLTLQAKFPGQSLDEIADKVWAERDKSRDGLIPPIKEFRSLTGRGLKESKDAIEAARDRAASVS